MHPPSSPQPFCENFFTSDAGEPLSRPPILIEATRQKLPRSPVNSLAASNAQSAVAHRPTIALTTPSLRIKP